MDNRETNYTDEISLKELILNLIDYKRLIIVITIVSVLLGMLYAFVIKDELYEASVDGTILISESATSKYGTFVFPSTLKSDYLNVLLSEEVLSKVKTKLELSYSTDELKKKVNISTSDDSSNFSISIRDNDKQYSKVILNELTSTFVNSLNMKYKKLAVDMFERDYFVQIRSLNEQVDKKTIEISELHNQLSQISPVITLKKLVSSDPSLLIKIANDKGVSVENLSEEMMLEEIENPNYTMLEETLIRTETELIGLQTSIEQNQKLLDELKEEKAAITEYYTNGTVDSLDEGSLEFMKSRINISSYLSVSENPVEPNKIMIILISLILGLMVGVFVAFFRGYWKNN